MPEETVVSTPAPEAAPPEDFREFKAFREGKVPEKPADEKPAQVPEDTAAKPAEEPKPAPDPDPDKPQEQEGEQKHKGGFQRRIDKLTREKRELEAKLAELADRPAVAKPAEKAPEGDPEPKDTDFTDYGEYVKALGRWSARQENRALESKRQAEQVQERQRQLANTWQERAQKALEKDPDFQDAIDEIGPALTRAGVADVVMQSPVGPEMVAYLHEHQDEAARIEKLGSPTAIAVELGKLEARLTKAPEPAKPAVSKAPKPPSVVGGGSTGVFDVNDEKSAHDFAAWKKARNAQLAHR